VAESPIKELPYNAYLTKKLTQKNKYTNYFVGPLNSLEITVTLKYSSCYV